MKDLAESLFRKFSEADFLAMRGLANEVPLFIQAYDPAQEDSIRQIVSSVVGRLRNAGHTVKVLDLFDLVLAELREGHRLEGLIENERDFHKVELLETLKNYSNPRSRLVPRLVREIGDDAQLTLVTGAGRVFPFLRTHSLLESLQPAMVRRPVIVFFPGEYVQESGDGSQLRLFGSIPSPRIKQPYYRAMNLDHYSL